MKDLARIIQALAERVRTVFKDEKRRVNVLVGLGLCGMVLLCASEWLPVSDPGSSAASDPESGQTSVDSEAFASMLETRLSELLGSMDRVGRCKVMVTLAAGEQTVYAQDTERSGEDLRTEHVVLGQEPLVEGTQAPSVQGVAVVCDGGGDASVQYAVTQTVAALTGIGTNRITVSRMADNGHSE